MQLQQDHTKPSNARNYRHLARGVLQAMRRLHFEKNEERLICLVLEFSYCAGQDSVNFGEQDGIALLSTWHKSQASRAIEPLVRAKVVRLLGAQISFYPPHLPWWNRPLRNQRNPVEQLELEAWVTSQGLQGTLKLFELDEQIVETWLESESSSVATTATQDNSRSSDKAWQLPPQQPQLPPQQPQLPPQQPPVASIATQPATYISNRVLEISTSKSRVLDKSYWRDDYIMTKLNRRRALKEELAENKTPMAKRFAALYSTKPDRARELVATAVELECQNGKQPNPNAWLNTALMNEGITY